MNQPRIITSKQHDILEEVFDELLKELNEVYVMGGLRLSCIPEDKFREVFIRYGVIENIKF